MSDPVDAEALRQAERYAPLIAGVLAEMRSDGIAPKDCGAVAEWGIHVVSIKFLNTVVAHAIRRQLETLDPACVDANPSYAAFCLRRAQPYLVRLADIWKFLLMDVSDEEQIPEILLLAVRVVQTDRDLATLIEGPEDSI